MRRSKLSSKKPRDGKTTRTLLPTLSSTYLRSSRFKKEQKSCLNLIRFSLKSISAKLILMKLLKKLRFLRNRETLPPSKQLNRMLKRLRTTNLLLVSPKGPSRLQLIRIRPRLSNMPRVATTVRLQWMNAGLTTITEIALASTSSTYVDSRGLTIINPKLTKIRCTSAAGVGAAVI